MQLEWMSGRYAVAQLSPRSAAPPCPPAAELWALVRTRDETTLIAPERTVRESAKVERGFAALRVRGTLEFSLTGILAELTRALAEAEIPVLALSTFDTDYLLVREHHVDATVAALTRAGHQVHGMKEAR